MADLSSQLAAALGLAYQKPDFAAEDTYAPYAGLANQIQQVTNQANQFSTKDRLIATALTGLLGGVAQGYSDDYQTRAKGAFQNQILGNIYGKPVSADNESILGSKLFKVADENSALFNVARAEDDRLFDQSIDKAAIGEIVKNPYQKQQILESLPPDVAKRLGYVQKAETAPVVGEQPKENVSPIVNPLSTGQQGTSDKLKAYYSDFLRQGMPPVQAASAAKEQVSAEIKSNARGFDEAKAARENGQLLLQLANTAEAGMSQAGRTGSELASTYEKVVSNLSPILPGSQEEAKKQAAGDALISSIAPDLLKASRPAGVGAMSDPEMRVYLGTGPSTDKTPEQNAILVERMKNIANLNLDYADFLEAYKDANAGSVVGASKKWADYTRAFPLFKGGELDTSRPSWQEYFTLIGNGQNPNSVQLQEAITPNQQITGATIPQVGSNFNGETVLSVKKIR